MKIIILSFAFLFAVLFVNSCKEDETVAPDMNDKKITKFTEKIVTESATTEKEYIIEYENNQIKNVVLNNNGVKIKFEYYYQNNLLQSIKGIGIDNKELKQDVELFYENNNLIELVKKNNGEIKEHQKHFISGNTTNQVLIIRSSQVTVNSNIIKGLDTLIYSDFINERPTIFIRNKFSFNNGTEYRDIYKDKYSYQNGNMVEVHKFDLKNNNYILKQKNEFSTNIINNFTQKAIPFVQLLNFNTYFIPNYFNQNILNKSTNYSNYCNGDNFIEPIENYITDYEHEFSNGNLIKLKETTVNTCSDKIYTTTEYSIVWE